MKNIKSLTGTAVLAIGAIGLTTGTVHAAPLPADSVDAQSTVTELRGEAQGVGLTVSPTADSSGVRTVLDAGGFALTPDGRGVTVSDENGTVLETLPLAYQVADRTYDLRPEVGDAGRSLVLTPVGLPAADPAQRAELPLHFVADASDLARHQYNAGVGALIGGGLGALIGFFVVPIVGAIPGGVIGALLGAGIGWVQP
ncbi:hypothetical protein ACFYV7_40090 [Nocardia suismassiliense]|uniref:DUF8020 domain-containing protein n=1 Tax=Nocardia suismassiliense TaxID=2077092 RepID=A0ABW6R691_9NOCA